MKIQRPYPRMEVTPKARAGIRAGHPWIYDAEVTKADPCEDGGFADVFGPKGEYLGTGFYNSRSKIRIRLVTRGAGDALDGGFFARRLRHAWEYRKTVMGEDTACCRLIFGEADFFPGLTVDRFGDVLVAQTLSLGIERIKPALFPALLRILQEDGQDIRAVYERNDVPIRELEGMPQGKGFFWSRGPEPEAAWITENGVRYRVDFIEGQKTGFFLDQKDNRRAVAALCAGKRVLDCFTHTGSFALCAAKAGAASVHAMDVSESAVACARENARLNGLEDAVRFEAANVFDRLPLLRRGEYDLIILDPPAFTKSRRTVQSASRGYKEINLRAMKALPRGGYLATCSCSQFMTESLFRDVIRQAAADAGVSLRQVQARWQSPDHPILWNVPETAYLKFYIFQVV